MAVVPPVEIVEMDGKRLRLDAAAQDFYSEKEWEWLAFAERLVRDSGMKFDDTNVEWTKQFAARMATWECMVRAGLFLQVQDGGGWGAVL